MKAVEIRRAERRYLAGLCLSPPAQALPTHLGDGADLASADQAPLAQACHQCHWRILGDSKKRQLGLVAGVQAPVDRCDMMRRQGVAHVFDGPVCSSLEGEVSSPSPWQLQGAQRVSSSEYIRRVDYHQQYI